MTCYKMLNEVNGMIKLGFRMVRLGSKILDARLRDARLRRFLCEGRLSIVELKTRVICRFTIYMLLLKTLAFIVDVPASSSSLSHLLALKLTYQSSQILN